MCAAGALRCDGLTDTIDDEIVATSYTTGLLALERATLRVHAKGHLPTTNRNLHALSRTLVVFNMRPPATIILAMLMAAVAATGAVGYATVREAQTLSCRSMEIDRPLIAC